MADRAIVIGAGHNGLVCAAYLARAGVRPLVLEAQSVIGGCTATVDALGARVNVCNCDHVMIRGTSIADELDLRRHGLAYLDVEPAQLAVPDGRPPWSLHQEADRTLAGLAASYPGEVRGYRRYLADALPVARLVLELAAQPPGPRSVRRLCSPARARAAARLARWSRASALEVLSGYFGDEGLVTPALTTGPAVWGLAPGARGTGVGALGYAMRHVVPVGRPAGGSGALAASLLRALAAAGGELRLDAAVEEIVVDDGRVDSVVLASGERLAADHVVVACDPRTPAVRWLRGAPAAARAMAQRWREHRSVDGYESKVDAVIGVVPRVPSLDASTASTTVLAPSLSRLRDAHAAMAAGRVGAHPPMLLNVPSALDSSLRVGAEADHVLSLEALFTPYALATGWPGTEPERWLALAAAALEPDFRPSLARWRVVTPLDYERDQRLPRGHAASFPKSPVAAIAGRDRELTRYRTAVRGLYLTGAATFPGAGIWGASGRNAAAVALKHITTV